MAQDAALTLQPLTASALNDGRDAAASVEQLTATAVGSQGAVVDAALSLERATATGEASAGSVATAAVEVEQLTASAAGPDSTDISLEVPTVSAVGLTGTLASAALVLRVPTAEVENTSVNDAVGTAVMQTAVADADGHHEALGTAAVTLRQAQVSAQAVVGTVAIGSVELEALTVATAGAPAAVGTAAITGYHMRATAEGEQTVTEAYRTWAANTANGALTEYTSFPFNSYAYMNGRYYAAGPSGLFYLEGDDDAGTDISWAVRTGFMDDKSTQLKRLEEVVMAARFDAPVRLRVWTNESTYYDYTINNFRPDVLEQVRAVVGKGMRSRYFRVEVSGMSGAVMELDSMQLPMTQTARRIG